MKAKRIPLLVVLSVLEIAFLMLPLIGLLWSLGERQWVLSSIFGASYFLLRWIIFKFENHIGMRSPNNPNSKIHQSGITFISPWIKKSK
jgi:hypothetical protein